MSSESKTNPIVTKPMDTSSGEEATETRVDAKTADKPKIPKKARDWDKIVRDLEAEDKEEEDSDPNRVFQMLYKNADEETRRAMNKSFVESNGTTLSMDWKSVGKKFVKPYEDEKDSDSDGSDKSDDESKD